MKKIILSAVILAGLAFASCNKDDDKDNNNCISCTFSIAGQSDTSEVCNVDGKAVSDGVNTEMDYDTYVNGLKQAGATCN